jgi:hypothetical protein
MFGSYRYLILIKSPLRQMAQKTLIAYLETAFKETPKGESFPESIKVLFLACQMSGLS